jgi:hypothetical protein
MLRELLLWIVAVIDLVAAPQSASAQVIARRISIRILFEVAEGATCAQGSISWNVTGPPGPLHINFAPSPVPGAVSLSVFTRAATSFASQSIAHIFTPRRGRFHA